jgi:SpoIID/LytB domain protein
MLRVKVPEKIKKVLSFWGLPLLVGLAVVVSLSLVLALAGNRGKPKTSDTPASEKPRYMMAEELDQGQGGLPAAGTSESNAPAGGGQGTSASSGTTSVAGATLSDGGEVPGPDAVFVFRGYGRAHGVGLCMDGVLYRAQSGQTYQQILNYYYTGVSIGQTDDGRTVRVKCRDGAVRSYSMKEYLYRLAEEPDSWPPEGLKVLYVAARTYTLNVIARGKHAASGYDICSSGDCCQAFDAGRDLSKVPNSIAAVNATAGQILTYNGAPITAAYCGSCGGHTENNEDVWGGQALPYLRGKPDTFCSRSPRYCGVVEMSVSSLKSKLSGAGVSVGDLKLIDLSDRTPGGRVRNVKVVGTSGTKSVSGKTFAKLLNLNTRLEYSFR